MGCTQSKIENEEAVSRCKERKVFMKDAVSSRNAFAAAHSSYTISLKNTGAALSDYAQGEVQDTRPTSVHHHPSSSSSTSAAVASSSSAVAQPPMENLPPPPPPLPDFSPPPLQRSASMPDLPIPKSKKFAVDASIREEEDGDDELDDDDDDDRMDTARPIDTPPPPPQPQPQPQPTTKPPPPMPESKGMEWDYFFTMDENMPGPSLDPPEEIRPEIVAPPPPSKSAVIDDVPPITPEKVVLEPPKKQKQKQSSTVHHQHAASAGAAASSESKKGKMVAAPTRNVSLFQILSELDDHFLKASESAHEVSKMLEANRMHYHSNFADNRGHIDHSARVLRVITWNKSLKGIPNADDGKDDFDTDEWETHATVLDKLLAWEKKLYDEVKAGELMKIEYQRKVSLLNKQKKHGAKPETLEKTKAAVSHLHTRYIVDMQSMDSTVSEIQDLRDKRLYPKLVELVEGMAKMWETMHAHHGLQLRSVGDIRALDTSNAPKETSDQHHDRTIQLLRIVREWHSQFQKLVNHQKEYIQALNSWLRLNLIPIESSLKEKVSSPPRVLDPPIKALLHAWHDQLEKLPTDLARVAIFSFSEVIDTIVLQQQEELKQKEKCEEIYKEYQRKFRAFEDWKHKYSQRRAAAAQPEEEVVDQERSSEGANQKDPLAERGFVVEALKKRHEDEVELHQKLCKQVREKSLGSFKTHLPELFRSMTDFALSSSEMYKKLASISN